MNEYIINITEEISEGSKVKAYTPDDALAIAIEKYNNQEFILEPGILAGTRFEVYDIDKYGVAAGEPLVSDWN